VLIILKMKQFAESKDPVEILFKSEIEPRFPNYSKFWEQFIGFREDHLPKLLPYGLTFPENYDKDKKQKIADAYSKILESNYHLFRSLANVHFDVRDYLSNYKVPGPKCYFIRSKAFDSFYLNLGICRDMVSNLVESILIEICGEAISKSKECNVCHKKNKSTLDEFYEYLKQSNQQFAEDFKNWKSRVGKIRSRLNHINPIGKQVYPTGEEFITREFYRGTLGDDWNKMRSDNKIEIREVLENDLEKTEKLLNLLYTFFSGKLKDGLSKEKIVITY